MVNEHVFRWFTMVKLGFIVEGKTEKLVIESDTFKAWLEANGCERINPVLDANGGGNLLPQHIEPMVNLLKGAGAEHIIILTDLELDPDFDTVKNRITTTHTDLIFIAVKAIEAWFLADSQAMNSWLETTNFHEASPENTIAMPWDRLKEIAEEREKRGPGTKVKFTKKILKCGYDTQNAAEHGNAPSAEVFLNGLKALAE